MGQLEDLKLIASCLSPGPVLRELTLRPSSRSFFEPMKLQAQHVCFFISTESHQFLAHQLNSLVAAGKGCNGS